MSSTLPAAPAFGSGGAVDDPRDAGEDDRPRAHRARLERHVEDRVGHPPAAEPLGGGAQGKHLGVRGRVGAQLALVAGRRDHLAVADDDGSDRHVAVLGSGRRLRQRQAHGLLVAREELLAHG